jgi:hypothetical protein
VLKLDFAFESGAGFCVVRRAVAIDLPANYRFSFAIRGEAPANNLEFKLLDPSGENVWWVNRRAFEFPRQWRVISTKARQFRFAWGPSGGKPLERLSFIEFAVAAGSGGKGFILIDSLTFEDLPPPQPATQPAMVSFSSSSSGPGRNAALDDAGEINWQSEAADTSPWLQVDMGQWRELGGVVLDWGTPDFATDYDVTLGADGKRWEPAATVRGGNGGRDYVSIPDGEARHVRICVSRTSRGQGVTVRSVRIMGPEFAESPNAMFQTIAREAREGLYPRYFLGRQTPWTVVGVPGDACEALFNTDGALEVDKLGFRIEPFILVGDRLVTWADTASSPSLAQGYLPVPSVTWTTDALSLEITPFADGEQGSSILIARYRLRNRGEQRTTGRLALAIRPFQVLPPWQELNVTGGVAAVDMIAFDGRKVVVNGRKVVAPWTAPSAFGAAAFAQGEIAEHLAAGKLPADSTIADPAHLASAALMYSFDLGPGESQTVAVAVPFHSDLAPSGEASVDEHLRRVCDAWTQRLNRVRLSLPPSADRIANTFRTTQGYILINADGPAIQPGSRSYERSWIRDGAITSTALLSTGHPEQVLAFLDWYAPYQFPNGKVPCVVDSRGPDPVPEHDSHGEYIYAVLKYYRFTRDREFLERHLPRVVAAVDYIRSLREQRMTDEYKDGEPAKRACYGLVPESISHEGYSAKPMHSYWDDFFVLKGLTDATTIAGILGRADLESRFAELRDAFRASLYDSMRLAMKTKGIDYVPGCVERGDFDATSTAVGVFPCDELGLVPEPQLGNTFEKYYDFFTKRRDNAIEWRDYTPYETRLIGTFVRLGRKDRAHELVKFFLNDQRPQGWNQWGEIVWRDPNAPRFVGDMPHTWVGSDFVNSVRAMFVYELDREDTLVLAAGVLPEWVESPQGVSIESFPTVYGRLSYTLSADGDLTVLDLRGELEPAPKKIVLRSPCQRPIRAVTVDGRPHTAFGDHEVTFTQPPAKVVIEHAK